MKVMNQHERQARVLLAQHGISQRELAKEMGVHEETVRYRLRTMTAKKLEGMSQAVDRIVKERMAVK